jgi:hypothetical protein
MDVSLDAYIMLAWPTLLASSLAGTLLLTGKRMYRRKSLPSKTVAIVAFVLSLVPILCLMVLAMLMGILLYRVSDMLMFALALAPALLGAYLVFSIDSVVIRLRTAIKEFRQRKSLPAT